MRPVRLLNEVEDEFQASIDFVRIIDHFEKDDLKDNSTWEQLAILEAILLEEPNLTKYQYPLFGVQANSGIASSTAVSKCTKTAVAEQWLGDLQSDVDALEAANDTTRQEALENLGESAASIPSPKKSQINADDLRDWSAREPEQWLQRMDQGQNISSNLTAISAQLGALMQGENAGQIASTIEVNNAQTRYSHRLAIGRLSWSNHFLFACRRF